MVLLVITVVTALATGFGLFFRLAYIITIVSLVSLISVYLNIRKIEVSIDRRNHLLSVGEQIDKRISIRNLSVIPKTLILLLLSLPFILPGEGPILIYFIMNVIWFGIILLLIRYYWRFNPLSFLLGAFTMEALPDILNLISKIQDPTYRNQIFMAIFCITIFFLYFIKDLFSKTEIVNE